MTHTKGSASKGLLTYEAMHDLLKTVAFHDPVQGHKHLC